MNYYHYEKTGEYNRQRIMEEIDQIRLEEFAMQASESKHDSFGQAMIRIANWLISEGMLMRKHFEYQSTRHGHLPSKHIAR